MVQEVPGGSRRVIVGVPHSMPMLLKSVTRVTPALVLAARGRGSGGVLGVGTALPCNAAFVAFGLVPHDPFSTVCLYRVTQNGAGTRDVVS